MGSVASPRTRRVVATIGSVSILVTVALVGAAARSSGAPTTSTTAPTTTTDVFTPPPPDEPTPLQLYPRRPGAKYEDVEARPGAAVAIDLAKVRVIRWSVEPHAALPGPSVPGDTKRAAGQKLIDGYTPYVTDIPGDVLHVVVRITPTTPLPVALGCVATAASDGTVLVPYDRPPPAPPTSTSSTAVDADAAPEVLDFYLPLGERRGRFYFTCVGAFFAATFGDTRAVWGIDA